MPARFTISLFALALLSGCGKPKPEDEQVFGLHMGDAAASLSAVHPLEEPPLFNYAFVPKEANPPFNDYAVLAGPGAGVCAVRARATETVPDVQALVERLRGKYGAGSSNAGLHSYYWFPSADSPPRSATIQTIALTDLGDMVSLTYTFTNMPACRKELGLDDPPPQAPPSE